MKALKLLCAILGITALHSAHADFIGLKGSIDYWQYNADLSHPQHNPSQSELDDDRGLAFSAAIEHPVPFLPNVKIKHINLQAESAESFSDVHRNQLDINYSDFILYYEILDNIINADVGAGVKSIEGDIRHNYTFTQDISETLPMLYAQAGVKLPLTGLSANAEVSVAGLNHEQVTDAQAELKYNFIDSVLVDVGAKIGYRILDIQLKKDSDDEAKLKFKGPYLGVEAHF
jgi:outer membrane protein